MHKKFKFGRNLCFCCHHWKFVKHLGQKCDCECENQRNHQAHCKCCECLSSKQIITKCDWRMQSHYIGNRYFCLNLAGLTDNINYKLLSKRRRPIEIGIIEGNHFNGKSKYIGIDYLDIKEKDGSIVTILKDKITYIKWLNGDIYRLKKNITTQS